MKKLVRSLIWFFATLLGVPYYLGTDDKPYGVVPWKRSEWAVVGGLMGLCTVKATRAEAQWVVDGMNVEWQRSKALNADVKREQVSL